MIWTPTEPAIALAALLKVSFTLTMKLGSKTKTKELQGKQPENLLSVLQLTTVFNSLIIKL